MIKNKKIKTVVPPLRFPEFRDAEGWRTLYGCKVFEQISNKYHNSDLPILAISQEHGAIPRDMIDYNVVVTDKSIESYKVVDIDDFIISLRSFQGGIEHSIYRGICSPAYIILRKKIDLSNQFFKQYFKSYMFIQDLNKNLEGIRDGKMVSYKQFSEILLPVPTPNEQSKIADCLGSLDDLISAVVDKIETLKLHKKSLMQQLFPAEGKTTPAYRFPEFQNAPQWQEKPIEEIFTIRNGYTPSKSNPDFWTDGTIPWFRMEDIRENGTILSDSIQHITPEAVKGNGLFPANSIIVATTATIGVHALIIVDSLANQRFTFLTKRKSLINKLDMVYFYHYMFIVDEWCKKNINMGGFASVNMTGFKKLLIPIPKPAEQQRIADCLSSVDELISAEIDKLDQLKAHKKGLMQQLFPIINE